MRLGEPNESSPKCDLTLVNRQRDKRLNVRLLREVTEAALCELPDVTGWTLCIHFIGAKRMARINESHLNHEGATDVITFDYNEPATRSKQRVLNGEIFICVEVAVKQAREFKVTWQSEVVRYIVHGLLHLCGYDDLNASDRREMKRHENGLLKKLAGKYKFADL